MTKPFDNPMVGIEAETKETDSSQEAGFILGYKILSICNAVKGDEKIPCLALRSPQTKQFWKQRVEKAECSPYVHHEVYLHLKASNRKDCHVPPQAKCTCGLYAFYNLKKLLDAGFAIRLPKEELVIVLVKGWGKTQLHEEGFRTEYMEIIALLKNPHPKASAAYQQKVQGIAGLYDVNTVEVSGLRSLVGELGGEQTPPLVPKWERRKRKAHKKWLRIMRRLGLHAQNRHRKRRVVLNLMGILMLSGIIFGGYKSITAIHQLSSIVYASATSPQLSGPNQSGQISTLNFDVHNGSNHPVDLQVNTNSSGADKFLAINTLQKSSTCHQIDDERLDCGNINAGGLMHVQLQFVPLNPGDYKYTFLLADNNNYALYTPKGSQLQLDIEQTVAK